MAALYQASQVSYPFGYGPAEFQQVRSIQEVSDSARYRFIGLRAFPPPFLHLYAAIGCEQSNRRGMDPHERFTDMCAGPLIPPAALPVGVPGLGAARGHLSRRRFRPTDE